MIEYYFILVLYCNKLFDSLTLQNITNMIYRFIKSHVVLVFFNCLVFVTHETILLHL